MKIKYVINKMVLILLLMVIIIPTPLCKIIISIFLISSLYRITNLSEEDKAKQDVIEAVFNDDEYGYGSKVNTLTHARQIDKNITMDDIRNLWIKYHLGINKDIAIKINLLISRAMNSSWI